VLLIPSLTPITVAVISTGGSSTLLITVMQQRNYSHLFLHRSPCLCFNSLSMCAVTVNREALVLIVFFRYVVLTIWTGLSVNYCWTFACGKMFPYYKGNFKAVITIHLLKTFTFMVHLKLNKFCQFSSVYACQTPPQGNVPSTVFQSQ
jgi:hypothetical protein